MTPIQRLKAAGVESPVREWRILESHFEGEALEATLTKRLSRMPMAQIIGYRDFWEDRFIVTADVLDPRPDSEILVELAIATQPAPQSILDLGAGSGALGISAAKHFPNASLTLVDYSESALEIANKNATALGVGERLKIIHSNWFENIHDRYDLILCNPPYLNFEEYQTAQVELSFEPSIALTDNLDGLEAYRVISSRLSHHLSNNGVAFFEHGFEQQEIIASIFEEEGFFTEKFADLNKKPRVLRVFYQNL